MDLTIGRYSVKFTALSVAAQAKYQVSRAKPDENGKPSPSNGDKWQAGGNKFAEGKVYYDTAMQFTDAESGQTLDIEDAVCSANRSKEIVKTQLVGMEGTIKEYISMGDYDININFNIVSFDEQGNIIDHYPAQEVKKLEELFSVNRTLQVKSNFLSVLGVTKIVISSLSITQQTYSNIQQVQITALSDEDFEITCKE